ncbi:MAG TPA: hypothetical protein P5279_03435 [Anaerohalosphaeraceae bacterium]|jgi:DNA-directed RNA polymerase subunit RPC12/RpoP|nr:hypothetical protein [Anaerohalosphaeraceae bacterium]HRT49524.1 hypothetical protein [Anaerohalosphaeraceae bacterium]HRT85314.1 hypothetical protein [Anaerohalosphaeraceae bacterium]
MTISFKCPHCDNLCAFADRHAGRRARCTRCQGRFFIPSRDGDPARKVRDVLAEAPLSGFYRAVFIDTWPLFIRPENIASLVFLAAVVCFRFFLVHQNYSFVVPGFGLNVPTDWIVAIISWGCLFWFYMSIVEAAAMGQDELPDIEVGQGFEFIWTMLKSIYLFIVAAVLALLPFVALIEALRSYLHIELGWFRHVLVAMGLFIFPMTLLTICCAGEMWMVFRPDYIVLPIIRAPRPYLVTAFLVAAAGLIQAAARHYGTIADEPLWVIAAYLLLNLLAVVAGILAMRTVGLFLRHYSVYFDWKK